MGEGSKEKEKWGAQRLEVVWGLPWVSEGWREQDGGRRRTFATQKRTSNVLLLLWGGRSWRCLDLEVCSLSSLEGDMMAELYEIDWNFIICQKKV